MSRRAAYLTCTVPDCDRPYEARDLCQMHYFRARRGTPLGNADSRTRGPGDKVPSYRGAHKRVYAARGKASAHLCLDCGGTASQWSYTGALHGDEWVSPKGLRYSADPRDYEPRCKPCHLAYDRSESKGKPA